MEEVLTTLHDDPKNALCTVSDAPLYQMIIRLIRTNTHQFFDRVYGQKNEDAEYVEKVMKKADELGIQYEELPDKKPNIELAPLLHVSRKKIHNALTMVGNSPSADMGLADNNNSNCILAGWGSVPARQSERVLQLSNPDIVIPDMQITKEVHARILRMGKRLKVAEHPREILENI